MVSLSDWIRFPAGGVLSTMLVTESLIFPRVLSETSVSELQMGDGSDLILVCLFSSSSEVWNEWAFWLLQQTRKMKIALLSSGSFFSEPSCQMSPLPVRPGLWPVFWPLKKSSLRIDEIGSYPPPPPYGHPSGSLWKADTECSFVRICLVFVFLLSSHLPWECVFYLHGRGGEGYVIGYRAICGEDWPLDPKY